MLTAFTSNQVLIVLLVDLLSFVVNVFNKRVKFAVMEFAEIVSKMKNVKGVILEVANHAKKKNFYQNQ
jgi:hypothetical protein